MTISTTESRISYNGNGVTTVFSFPYRFLANGDLVVLSVSSTGVETTKALTTDYTLTGAGDDAGGSVTMLVAPASGTRLIIYRDTAITQETDYISGDPFPAETHERALDRLTMIAQEIGSDADRSIKVPVGDSSSLTTVLPAAANRLDKFIVFDSVTGETELSTVTQTQVASAVAAAYAAGSTADAVTFLQAGTGAESRSVQSKLREWVSITDFGALGAGNDATIFQEAIDAVKGTGNSLYIPPNTTIALGATGVTVTAGVTIVGANRDRCFITWTGTTMVAVTVTTPDSCQFQNLYFAGPASCTNGAAISLSGSGGVANSFSKVNNCRFSNAYRHLYAPDAYAWEFTGNYVASAVNAGIYVGNTTTVDDGDSTIERNIFSGMGAASACVWQVSSGGLRVINNKMNGGLYGYYLQLASGAVTSILIITGNSIENQTHSGIVLNNSAGGGAGFSQVVIMGNQLAYQPTPINCLDPDAFNTAMVVIGNVIVAASGATTTAGITVTATPRTVVANNVIYGSGTTVEGILIGSASTDCRVSDNVITGCVTNVNNGGSSGDVASAASITLSTAAEVFTISGTTNITSISAASAVESRVVTLIFQGVLTFTDGNNLKLAGDFVTTADDTITLACNGTNWYEIARSAN